MTVCPSCQQPVNDPSERFCIHCGAGLGSDASPPEPISTPAAERGAVEEPGVVAEPGARTEPSGAPWDRRSELGFFTALVDTTIQVLSKPRAFYQRMAVAGGLGGPLLYGVLVGYVGLLATAVYDAIFEGLVGRQSMDLGLGPEFDEALALLEGGPGLIAQVLVGPFALAVGMLVGAGLNHLGLMLFGGARRDFEATFRVSAYSKAASVVSLVPLCGPFIAVVWSAILTIIGLQTVHDTTLAKAVAAVLLPIVVLCCCCAGSLGLLGALMASAAR
jgi:hypothetical protein